MKTYESLQNETVKRWASLLTKKGRDKHGQFLIEGVHLVNEALASGASIEMIAVLQGEPMPPEMKPMLDTYRGELVYVSQPVLEKCTDAEHPQPVFGVVNQAGDTMPEEALFGPEALVIVSDGLQDPGNLGTVIRTADAVGATAVIIGKGSVDPYNPKTVRASMGSLFHVPISERSLPALFSEAAGRGVQLVITSLEGAVNCYEADYRGPTWFVLGNEARGVSAEAMHASPVLVKIPIPGRAESLNVATAASVLLYEAIRQRHYSK